jgi:hypothetical protein
MSRSSARFVVLVLLPAAALATAGASCDGDELVVLDECVKANPRGTMGIASADVVYQAITECQGDSGGCMAATACVGQAGDRDCNPKGVISAAAAVCVAQANGLEPGIERLRSSLVYNYAHRRLTWNVSNVLYDSAREPPPPGASGQRGGVSMLVDAINAKLLARTEWAATQ